MPVIQVTVNSGPFARFVGEETAESDAYKARRDQGVAAVTAWTQDELKRDTELRKQLAATRRIITRNLNTATVVTQNVDAATVDSAFIPNSVIEKLKTVERARDKVEVFIVDLIDTEPWNRQYFQDLVNTLRNEHDAQVRTLTVFLQNVPQEVYLAQPEAQNLALPPAEDDAHPAPQMAGTAPFGVKANSALKPTMLTLEHNPVEMEEWIKAFEAYHSTSNMVKLKMSDQQAYFLQSLDPSITTLIRSEMTPGARLFGDEDQGCLVAILRRIFLQRYPIFARREQFFSRQFHGDIRELPAFMTMMHKERVAAEIDQLNANDLLAYRLLSAINDRELRKWCAREEVLTLDTFTRLAYQRVRELENLQKPSKQAANSYHSQSMLAVHDRCTYCNRPGHRVAECNTRRRDSDTAAAAARARKAPQPSRTQSNKGKTTKKSTPKGSGKKGKPKHSARQVEEHEIDEDAHDDAAAEELEEEDVRYVSAGYVQSP